MSVIERISSGGPWEETIGYSRAVRAGDRVLVSGCTATVGGVVTHVGDAYGQARDAIAIALDALAKAGARPEHVVRTRMFVVNRGDTDGVGRAHGETFRDIRPAASMILVAGLIDPDHLVEIEMEAYVG